MGLDFIDISKADEEERGRSYSAGKTSKSKTKVSKSVFLDINEEAGENAVYESAGSGRTAVGGGPVRTAVRTSGRTVVNIDVSRNTGRERSKAEERIRAGNAPGNRSRSGNAQESRRRSVDVRESRRRDEDVQGSRRRSVNVRESRSRSRNAQGSRGGAGSAERSGSGAEGRRRQQNAGARRRAAEAKAQREREERRRRRRRQQMAAKFTVLVFMAAFVSMLLFVFIRLVKGGTEGVETVKGIENTFSEKAARREVIKTNKTQKPVMEEDFLTVNEYSRPGEKLEKVNNIFVHYTANKGTSAAQNRSYFENLGITGETSASAHFIIGFDGEIVQCIPLEEIAYAVQKRNYDSISIECCYLQDDGRFTDATYQSLIRLSAWLLNEYNLAPEDMRRHYDEGGKKCPLYYVEHEDAWEQFLKDLREYIMSGKTGEV